MRCCRVPSSGHHGIDPAIFPSNVIHAAKEEHGREYTGRSGWSRGDADIPEGNKARPDTTPTGPCSPEVPWLDSRERHLKGDHPKLDTSRDHETGHTYAGSPRVAEMCWLSPIPREGRTRGRGARSASTRLETLPASSSDMTSHTATAVGRRLVVVAKQGGNARGRTTSRKRLHPCGGASWTCFRATVLS